jgi:hypothetical protein
MAAFDANNSSIPRGATPYFPPSLAPSEGDATPAQYPRHPGYPVSGHHLNATPPSGCGESVRIPAGRYGFRRPRMYTGGYRGFAYRGGMW